jgi:predicted dehydrogenase
MSNSAYRVALVGAGGISRAHSQACSLTDRAHLVAVSDVSQASLDRYREQFPEVPATYLELDRMLAREGIDIAIICTWGAHHAAVGERLARSGKVRAILCEKPFTQTAREAEHLVAAANDSGTIVMEAFKFRHHPLHLKARALIDAGRIGVPLTVRSTFCTGGGRVGRTPEMNWRFNRQRGGGSIFDLGCYNIHHARWIFGTEPVAVFASARRGVEVDDAATIQLVFPHGGSAQITVAFDSWASQTVEIMGTTGSLRTDRAWNNENRSVSLERDTKGLRKRLHFAPVFQFQLQLEHLCEVLDGTTEARIPAHNSIDQMKVIDAVYESIERGVVVTP